MATAEIIRPFFFWLNNPHVAPQIEFIKENNPGMTVDVSDVAQALLIPVCKRCGTDAGMCFHEKEDAEGKMKYFYRCVVCGRKSEPAATKQTALKAWFTQNAPDTN